MFFIYMLFVVKKKKEKEKKRKKRETIQFWRNAHQYIYIYIEKKKGGRKAIGGSLYQKQG